MADPTVDAQRFQTVRAEVETRHRIIAALKVQRWEVLKWAVALNLGLITAWVALGKQPSWLFTILAALIAGGAIVLLWHYNRRATGARADLRQLFRLFEHVITYEELRAQATFERIKKQSRSHDGWELVIFSTLLILTVVVTYFITATAIRW